MITSDGTQVDEAGEVRDYIRLLVSSGAFITTVSSSFANAESDLSYKLAQMIVKHPFLLSVEQFLVAPQEDRHLAMHSVDEALSIYADTLEEVARSLGPAYRSFRICTQALLFHSSLDNQQLEVIVPKLRSVINAIDTVIHNVREPKLPQKLFPNFHRLSFHSVSRAEFALVEVLSTYSLGLELMRGLLGVTEARSGQKFRHSTTN
jgi:hypothetical protein